MPSNEQNLPNSTKLNSIEDAINDIRLGKVVVVLDRSEVEIPVVHPCPIKSTETVNCVLCKTVLF